MFHRVVVTGLFSTGVAIALGLVAGSLNAPAPAAPAQPLPSITHAVQPTQAPTPEQPTEEQVPVRWHPTIEAARNAAKTSGKPVLVFHMMGRLDQEFC